MELVQSLITIVLFFAVLGILVIVARTARARATRVPSRASGS
jgi:hypothetical protein